ncbi:MAG: nuclear transport factor 2 family protein [Algicola sp.]|nr:nuclear transport factor 2 family protein [Algicola sp.]
MKKLFLLALSVILFTACEQSEKRYTMQSSEIDTVKKAIDNYNNKTYDKSIYADTSQTFFNSSSEKGMSTEETINYHKQNDMLFSNRSFTGEDPEYEMVVTDEGKTWVNCWLDWKGTLAENGKVIEIPIHLTYQFVDGKIVREVGYWDPTEVVLNLQAIEAEKNATVEEDIE